MGLVRMNSGKIDERTLILDADWVLPEDSEPSEDEDGDEEMIDFYGNDGDDEDEDEGEEDEEHTENEEGEEKEEEDDDDVEESEIELPFLPSKRKRPSEPLKGPAASPTKRVASTLQRPSEGANHPSKRRSLNPSIKKPTLASEKRR